MYYNRNYTLVLQYKCVKENMKFIGLNPSLKITQWSEKWTHIPVVEITIVFTGSYWTSIK